MQNKRVDILCVTIGIAYDDLIKKLYCKCWVKKGMIVKRSRDWHDR